LIELLTYLSFFSHYYALGAIKRVIMGLNKYTREPCGFCFVEYYSHDHAAAALKYISGTVCDGNIIRCDMDAGFIEGRQYGRGASGAQRRDENRQSYDPSRAGPAQRGYQDQAILNRIGGVKRERVSHPAPTTTDNVDNVVSNDSMVAPPPVTTTELTAEEERDNDIDEDDRHKSKRVRRSDE